MKNGQIVLVGLNHKSASVEVRERLAVPAAHLVSTLDALSRAPGVSECYMLSTCNRIEVLAALAGKAADPADGRPLERFLAERLGLEETELARLSYRLEGREAVAHLLRVAAGLDSMILGEPQILGQTKEAYGAAHAAGTLGPVLEPLLQKTFAVAKRIRTETGVGQHAVSVAYAAVEMGHQIFGDLKGHVTLLVGVGKMAGLAARNMIAHGVDSVIVTSRSYSHAVAMAGRFSGQAIAFDKLPRALEKADIVISSTAAPHAVIRKEHVVRAMKARWGRPLFFIDIAVPRDIEPAVNELDNVYLFNIDDLHSVVDANLEERRREAGAAEKIVERESAAFFRRLSTSDLGPVIASVRQAAERVRADEFRKMRNRLGPLTPRQEEQIEALTRALTNKFLHRPIRELKRFVIEKGEVEAAEIARRFFEIGSEGDHRVSPVSPSPPGDDASSEASGPASAGGDEAPEADEADEAPDEGSRARGSDLGRTDRRR